MPKAKISPRQGKISYKGRKPKQIKSKGASGGSLTGSLPRKFDNMTQQAKYQAMKKRKKR